MAKITLDARGLICPLPVLKANKAIKDLSSGDILEILATDANVDSDIASFCKSTGHELVESVQSDGVFTIIVRKV